jgi:hypothetical protein
VGSGNDPDVDLDGVVGADRADLTFLEDAEQGDLRFLSTCHRPGAQPCGARYHHGGGARPPVRDCVASRDAGQRRGVSGGVAGQGASWILLQSSAIACCDHASVTSANCVTIITENRTAS